MRNLLIVAVLITASTAMAVPPPPASLPDAGSSLAMLGVAMAAVAFGKRLFTGRK
jgi:hypothetical protein